MGWSGYTLTIGVSVDAHGGDRQERGEKRYEEFTDRLTKLCEEFTDDDGSLMVTF